MGVVRASVTYLGHGHSTTRGVGVALIDFIVTAATAGPSFLFRGLTVDGADFSAIDCTYVTALVIVLFSQQPDC